MSEIAIPLVYQLTAGGLGGYLLGYALKKVTKLIAFLIGIILLAIIYLTYSGMLNINYEGFINEIKNALTYLGEGLKALTPFIANLPFIGSFILGLFIAWKIA
ncbi:MAG: FUN14 domain-containing protein [Candidatus Bathyarchaeales archaeon]